MLAGSICYNINNNINEPPRPYQNETKNQKISIFNTKSRHNLQAYASKSTTLIEPIYNPREQLITNHKIGSLVNQLANYSAHAEGNNRNGNSLYKRANSMYW